ncbi:MAG: hypothetical protein Q8J87_05130, partial [Sediminibacterium sp.]|nr:hypothetical protein [Sediminibacterium sp.]
SKQKKYFTPIRTMSVNTKYTDKPNDQYQRANLKGLVGYFHKRCKQPTWTHPKFQGLTIRKNNVYENIKS